MPMSLFRFPWVASTIVASPQWAARIEVSISFTVVLPLLPVSATSGSAKRARQCAASLPSATRVSSTTTCGTGICALTSREVIAATAPCAIAWPTYSLPSKRSPLSATNRSPVATLRLSVVTPEKRVAAPCTRPPTARPASCKSIIGGGFTGSLPFMSCLAPIGRARRLRPRDR